MPFTDVVQGIPFLQKADLIKHIDEIVTYKSKLASAKTTGGSTGEPVKLYKNPDALARERAATWRSYGWAGITKIGRASCRGGGGTCGGAVGGGKYDEAVVRDT